MALDDDVEAMKATAVEMAGYYYKGMGMALQGLLCNAELYQRGTEERPELRIESYEIYEGFLTWYEKIPFDELQGREEFYPLFVIKNFWPRLRQTMDAAFSDDANDTSIHDLQRSTQTVVDVGTIYWERMIGLLDRIRCHEGHEEFRVAVPDQNKDYTWYF